MRKYENLITLHSPIDLTQDYQESAHVSVPHQL